jgi:parallel beta-helix repeat protein
MLTLTFSVLPVRAQTGTIYIRADGSIDPPDASISTLDKITYTFTDNIINDSIVVERNNMTLDGAGYLLQGSGSGKGITLYSRSNVTIRDVRITSFSDGLYLEQSSHVYVYANTITGNDWENVQTRSSNYNVFSGNNLTASNGDGLWIRWSSDHNTVTANNIIGNGAAAVDIESSNYNTVSGNNMINNTYGPLFLSSSSYNEIFENLIQGSQWSAIYLHTSSDNSFYHNNLLNNVRQVYTYDSVNIWDNGYPSGGNYWNDYIGSDANGDRIGDTPYTIDSNNTDNYPLMLPWRCYL